MIYINVIIFVFLLAYEIFHLSSSNEIWQQNVNWLIIWVKLWYSYVLKLLSKIWKYFFVFLFVNVEHTYYLRFKRKKKIRDGSVVLGFWSGKKQSICFINVCGFRPDYFT